MPSKPYSLCMPERTVTLKVSRDLDPLLVLGIMHWFIAMEPTSTSTTLPRFLQGWSAWRHVWSRRKHFCSMSIPVCQQEQCQCLVASSIGMWTWSLLGIALIKCVRCIPSRSDAHSICDLGFVTSSVFETHMSQAASFFNLTKPSHVFYP